MNSGIEREELAAGIRKIIDKKVNGKLPNLCVVTTWLKDDGERQSETVFEEPIREPGKSTLLVSVDRLVELVDVSCGKWAENIGGMVRFTFRIYVEGNPRPVFTQPLAVYSDEIVSVDNHTGLPSGDMQPTRRGEHAMDLRHRENLHRLNLDSIQQNQRRDAEMIRHLQGQVLHYMAAHARLSGILETAQSQAMQRQMMQQEAHQKSEMLKIVLGKVLMYLPMIIQHVVGGKGAVINTGGDLALESIRGMYQGLPEEARNELNGFMMQFFGKMDQQVQHVMMKLLKSMSEDQKNDQIKAVANIATSMPSLGG